MCEVQLALGVRDEAQEPIRTGLELPGDGELRSGERRATEVGGIRHVTVVGEEVVDELVDRVVAIDPPERELVELLSRSRGCGAGR